MVYLQYAQPPVCLKGMQAQTILFSQKDPSTMSSRQAILIKGFEVEATANNITER